jgi:hypothetical protein
MELWRSRLGPAIESDDAARVMSDDAGRFAEALLMLS